MPSSRTVLILTAMTALLAGCGPGVKIPPVHEPLDSDEWKRCAGELADRESAGLIDDLTLDSKTLVCRGVVAAGEGKINKAIELLTEAGVRDKEDHRPHYLLGRILAEDGRYEEALAAFERSQERYAEMEVPTERLGRKVMDRDGDEPARNFLIKADKQLSYGDVRKVMRMIKDGGFEKIGLITERKAEK